MRAAAGVLRTAAGGVPRVALAIPPRARLPLIAVAVAAAALAFLYYGWFRDSGFVRVEKVTVTGLSGRDAPRARAALTAAARNMTTLHYSSEELMRVVGHFPTVRAVEVRPDFPHGMRIVVIANVPAAIVVADGDRVPVNEEGTILRGLPIDARLPIVRAGELPSGDRLPSSPALRHVAVAGAAPGALARRMESIGDRPGKGIVVELRDGPDVYFGDASRLDAKWAAVAGILADPSSRGATYVDVRLANRPVAGGVELPAVQPDPEDAPAPGAAPPAAPGTPAAPGASPAPGTTPAPTQTAPPSPTAPAPAQTAPPGQAQGTPAPGTQPTP